VTEDNNGEKGGLLTWHDGRENIAKMDDGKSRGFGLCQGLSDWLRKTALFGGNVALYLFLLLFLLRVIFGGLTECSPDGFLDMFAAFTAY